MPHAEQVVTSMRDLASYLAATAEEFVVLADRARAVADEVATGRPLHEVMAAEPSPLVIARLTEVLDDLADAGAAARRAEARQLSAEGRSQGDIARLFGVSRQRVSALLAAPPAAGARAAKRPARRSRSD